MCDFRRPSQITSQTRKALLMLTIFRGVKTNIQTLQYLIRHWNIRNLDIHSEYLFVHTRKSKGNNI